MGPFSCSLPAPPGFPKRFGDDYDGLFMHQIVGYPFLTSADYHG